jgi:hypothetical protein
MVSNLLNNVCDDVNLMYPMIAGLLGSALAVEFRSWCGSHSDLPDTERIFEGKPTSLPKSADTLYAVVASMSEYAKDCKDDPVRIGNSLRYAEGMPADYIAILLKNYEAMEEDYQMKLMQIPEYTRLLSKRGVVRNGSV